MGTLSVDKLVKTSAGASEFTLPATDGTANQVMQTDGSGQLSFATITTTTAGEITTANNFFQNWNEISTSTVSTFATTINAAIIGPITVGVTPEVSPVIWTVDGTLNIL